MDRHWSSQWTDQGRALSVLDGNQPHTTKAVPKANLVIEHVSDNITEAEFRWTTWKRMPEPDITKTWQNAVIRFIHPLGDLDVKSALRWLENGYSR